MACLQQWPWIHVPNGRKVLLVNRTLTLAAVLLFLNPIAVCQTPSHASDCSTLKYLRHEVSCLCGTVQVCSGDICLRPSDFDLDDDITVELREKSGTILDSEKVVVETCEKQGTTQDGTKTSYKETERRFCFEGKRDGDYLLAFVLHKNGVPQPAVIFPTNYSRKRSKACDSVYMVDALGQSRPTVPGGLESLRSVTDPNAMNENWQTPLMAAAFYSDENLVKDLIGRKANINVGSRFGVTALMYARGLPVVKLLLGAGASVKDKDITGKTALYWATQRADPEVVRVLIEAGANVNAKVDMGMSALQLAKAELLSSENDFSDKDMRDAYKTRVQKVIDLLVASGAKEDHP
jgi:hypothetical protein